VAAIDADTSRVQRVHENVLVEAVFVGETPSLRVHPDCAAVAASHRMNALTVSRGSQAVNVDVMAIDAARCGSSLDSPWRSRRNETLGCRQQAP
jgi:hypothetical protein